MRLGNTIIVLIVAAAIAGCASTRQVRDVHGAGFLGTDTARLQKGGDGKPALYYLKPGVDWASYDRMLLDPVTFWRPPEDHEQGASTEDIQSLVDYLHQLLYDTFSKQMKMVNTPQPRTLRVKVAITKAEKSHVALDIVSTIDPQMRAASALKDLITGKPAFVGAAQIAVKVTDAMTGEVLAEAVDERVGGKSLDAAHFKSWGDVDQALQYWVAHASWRLCELQKRGSCVKPS